MKKTKKYLALALAFLLTIAGTVGITVAYLTDTDEATNTFTIGNVEIELVEQQRVEVEDENGNKTTKLGEFVNDKVLLPIVGSAQDGEDEFGLPTAANWVDKVVDVKNTGVQDAWVRVLFAFPADMDDAQSAAEMMLHWNHNPEGYNWVSKDEGLKVTIDGRKYNVYSYTYQDILPVGETTTSHAITGVYIDSRVDATSSTDDGVEYITYSMVNGRKETVTSIPYAVGDGPQILVFAQAIQSAGFKTAADAFTASSFTLNPWNGTVEE